MNSMEIAAGRWNLSSERRAGRSEMPRRLFFFDEELPAQSRNVHHAYAPVEKVEVSFEGHGEFQVSAFASSFVRADDGCYRFYGSAHAPDFSWMGIGVWESEDGIHWHALKLPPGKHMQGRPNLIRFDGLAGTQSSVIQPQVVRLGDGRWRMYFWKHGDNHVRYVVAESPDGLAWKVDNVDRPALYHPWDNGFAAWAQGLTVHKALKREFTEAETLERLRLCTNDATHVYYNGHMGRYECYSVWLHESVPGKRVAADNAPEVVRIIHRRLSDDGLAWSDAEPIVIPDGKDPWDMQFYFLAVQWHESWMIGSLGHYRVEDGQQTIDTELCFSKDGKTWSRPLRCGFIERGGEGSMDSMGIYAPNAWIGCGDRWLSLYSATPDAHNASKHRMSIMGPCLAGTALSAWRQERTEEASSANHSSCLAKRWKSMQTCEAG